MSVSSGLSGRYAKAIYELAEEKKILTKIVDDFMKLKKLLDESDSLSNLIKSKDARSERVSLFCYCMGCRHLTVGTFGLTISQFSPACVTSAR